MKTTIEGVEIELTPEQIAKIEAAKKRPSPEQRFIEMINGCEIKIDHKEYPGSVFLMKGGEYMFEITKSGILCCSRDNVWNIFEKEYRLSYNEIQSLIKNQVEEHFKMKGIAPFVIRDPVVAEVEEHFKMKGITTV